MSGLPFSSQVSELGAITLRPFNNVTSQYLAEACAAIDPWAKAGIPASSLIRAFHPVSDAIHPRVIEFENQIAGAAIIQHPWLKGPYLQFLAILPSFQRRGIGVSILNWMEKEAGPSSRNLWVLATDFNEAALAFYENSGFTQVAPLPDLALDGCSEILLRKILSG